MPRYGLEPHECLFLDYRFFIHIVDCVWGAWSVWETCSVTCGGGTQERNRTISQPALNNGTDCVGNDTESKSCNNNGCPGNAEIQSHKIEKYSILKLYQYILVNCTWSPWSSWETCSVTCGGGSQERNRTISQPALNNGTDCVGNYTESQACNNNSCPGNVLTQ